MKEVIIKRDSEYAWVSRGADITIDISYVDGNGEERNTGNIYVHAGDRDYEIDVNYLMPDGTHLRLIMENKGGQKDVFSSVITQKKIGDDKNYVVMSEGYTLEFDADSLAERLISLALRSAESRDGTQVLKALKDIARNTPKERDYLKYHLAVKDEEESHELECHDYGGYRAKKENQSCHILVSGKASDSSALMEVLGKAFRGEITPQEAKAVLQRDFIIVSEKTLEEITLRFRDEQDAEKYYTFSLEEGAWLFKESKAGMGVLKKAELSEKAADRVFELIQDAMRGLIRLEDVVARKEELLSLVEERGKVKTLKR